MLVRIGNAKDIVAGEMRVFDLAGTKVNVANIAGQLHAFDDTCTHRACSLAKGKLDGTTVTCPCHGSQFDVTTGEVLGTSTAGCAFALGPDGRRESPGRVVMRGFGWQTYTGFARNGGVH